MYPYNTYNSHVISVRRSLLHHLLPFLRRQFFPQKRHTYTYIACMAARQCHDFRNCASMCKSNLRNSEPVPEQLVQGGYRTGAGEDCLIQHTHQCRSNNSSCLPLPLSNSLDEHTVGLGNESLDAGKLNWKERIRHYTWTFFAMTMATGGIANVLYAGKSCTYTNTYTCIGLQLTHPYSTLSFPRT